MSTPPFTPIIKEGWLMKEGHFIKSWKKRWFVLGKGVVKYFEKKYSNEKGSFNVSEQTTVSPARGPKNQPALYIKNPDKQFYIVCENEIDVENWINAFNRVIDAIKNGTVDQLGTESEVVNQFTNAVFKKEMIVPQYEEGDLMDMFNPVPHCPISQQQIFQLPFKLNQAFRLYIDLDYAVTQLIIKTTEFIRSIVENESGIPDMNFKFTYDDFYKYSQQISELIESIHSSDFSEVSDQEVVSLIETFKIKDFIQKMNTHPMAFESHLNQWIEAADKMHTMYDDLRFDNDPYDGYIAMKKQMDNIVSKIDAITPAMVNGSFDFGQYILKDLEGKVFEDNISTKTDYSKILGIFKSFNSLHKETNEALKSAGDNKEVAEYFKPRVDIVASFNENLLKALIKCAKRCSPSEADLQKLVTEFDSIAQTAVINVDGMRSLF